MNDLSIAFSCMLSNKPNSLRYEQILENIPIASKKNNSEKQAFCHASLFKGDSRKVTFLFELA